jgi:hypothetical protein
MYQNSHPAHMSSLGKSSKAERGGGGGGLQTYGDEVHDTEPPGQFHVTGMAMLPHRLPPPQRQYSRLHVKNAQNTKNAFEKCSKAVVVCILNIITSEKTTTPSTKSYPLPLSLPSSTPKFRFALLESPLDSSFPSPPPRPRPPSLHHILILFQVVCTLGTST